MGEAGPVARVGRNDFKQLPAQGLAGRVAAEPAQRQQRRGGGPRAPIARRGARGGWSMQIEAERSAADARATRAAAAAAAPRPPVIAVISHKS